MADWTTVESIPYLAAAAPLAPYFEHHAQPPVAIKYRNIGLVILLSIITLGIYNLYLLIEWAEEVNSLLGQKKYSPAVVLVVTLLTFCIAGTLFECLFALDIETASRTRNIRGRMNHLGLSVAICNICGFLVSFIPGGLVAAMILATSASILVQNELNKFARS
jgi:biotin transporter BioY